MKKYLILFTLFVLSLLLIIVVSCSGSKTPAPIVETTTPQTKLPESSETAKPETDPVTDAVTTAKPETTAPETTGTTETNNPNGTSGDITPEKYYENKLYWTSPYNYYGEILVDINSMFTRQYVLSGQYRGFDEYYLERRDIYQDKLPRVYHMIKYFNISKEDVRPYLDGTIPFYYDAEFSPKLTNEEIDILFSGDENLILKELHANSAFYYDGNLYDLLDLYECGDDVLSEMCEKANLIEYLERMAGYFEEGYWPDYSFDSMEEGSDGAEFHDFLDRIASLT